MVVSLDSRIISNDLAYQASEKSRLAKVEEVALYLILDGHQKETFFQRWAYPGLFFIYFRLFVQKISHQQDIELGTSE